MTINLELAALRDRIVQLEQVIAQWAAHLKLTHITPNTPNPVVPDPHPTQAQVTAQNEANLAAANAANAAAAQAVASPTVKASV